RRGMVGARAGGRMPDEALTELDENLWVASRPLKLLVGDVGCRMTVIRLPSGGLLLHSPVPLDPPTRAALDALGPVRWLVGPSKVPHFDLGASASAYPAAHLAGAPGLAEKRRDLRFKHVLADEAPLDLEGVVEHRLLAGAPLMNEVVFLHRPSRTLVLTD